MENITKKLDEFLNKKYYIYAMAGCIVISIVIAFIEFILEIFNISNTLTDVLIKLRALFIYFTAGSLVGLLVELRYRLKTVEMGTINNFCNRHEAKDTIKESIKNAALKSKNDPLVIKVYGWRLRQNIKSIKTALEDINMERKDDSRKIIIYLYYSNAEFLENLKSFKSDTSFSKMIDEQKRCIEEGMRQLREEILSNNYDFVEIKYRKHFDTPQFWVIQIGNHDIFWGYFKLMEKNGIECFDGSLSNCFHFKNGNEKLDGFFDWINNIFDRLDKWSKKSSKN